MYALVFFIFGVLTFLGIAQILDGSRESLIPFTFAAILFIVALFLFNPL